MAIYLYGRCSTSGQDTDNQLSNLKEQYSNAEVIEEIASGVKARPKLKELINKLEKDDVLVIPSLDRLGRKTSEVLAMIETLEEKGVVLRSAREGVDYGTIAGRLVTQILVSVSELERNLISERTKMALAAKKKLGITGGRPAIYSKKQINKAKRLREEGHTLQVISNEIGISISRLHQIFK